MDQHYPLGLMLEHYDIARELELLNLFDDDEEEFEEEEDDVDGFTQP